MWLLAIAGAAFLFWLWWTKRLSTASILPLILALLALAFLARGQVPIATGAGGLAALAWFSRRKNRPEKTVQQPSHQIAHAKRIAAEDLLGLRPGYDIGDVETAYRVLAKKAHPDAGGTNAEMEALSSARVLLTAILSDAHEKRGR